MLLDKTPIPSCAMDECAFRNTLTSICFEGCARTVFPNKHGVGLLKAREGLTSTEVCHSHGSFTSTELSNAAGFLTKRGVSHKNQILTSTGFLTSTWASNDHSSASRRTGQALLTSTGGFYQAQELPTSKGLSRKKGAHFAGSTRSLGRACEAVRDGSPAILEVARGNVLHPLERRRQVLESFGFVP